MRVGYIRVSTVDQNAVRQLDGVQVERTFTDKASGKDTTRPRLDDGVRVEFVKENLTFTGEDSPMANLLLSVMVAFAEFERALIRERQREGIAAAKQRGVYTGRKPALTAEQARQLRERATAGERKSVLATEFGISRETVYAYLR
jgi:DNA invertase Pin-like site-specific DNA recombinase